MKLRAKSFPNSNGADIQTGRGREDWSLLCAALLHDIGHGPFSHSIEDVFDTHHEALDLPYFTWKIRKLTECWRIRSIVP